MSLETITSNPWFAIVSLAVTTASLVAAFIFYKKARRDKIPCYSLTRQVVIENSTPLLPGLSVHFDGVIQQAIIVAQVAFWNSGAETIGGEDIADAKPLVIVIDEGVEVLNATILKRTDEANQFRTGQPQKRQDGLTVIPMTFDFLDRGDGALVQVVHNGRETTRVWIEGRIKGADNALRLRHSTPDQQSVRIVARVMRSRSYMAVGVSMYLVLGLVLIIVGKLDLSSRFAIFAGVLLSLCGTIGGLALLAIRRVPAAINPVDDEPNSRSV